MAVETLPLPNIWTKTSRSMDGYIKWLGGAEDLDDRYDVEVEYGCVDGSQFDTDKDGLGDEIYLRTSCLWRKVWSPVDALPSCVVTHCVDPFPIPGDTNLEEITTNWTKINEKKEYRCKGWEGDKPTRFWEKDRSKSTFEMLCLEDGTFEFENIRENWPTCLEGILIILTKVFIIIYFRRY